MSQANQRRLCEGCNSCASLAGLVLSFIACFVIAPLRCCCAQNHCTGHVQSQNFAVTIRSASQDGGNVIMTTTVEMGLMRETVVSSTSSSRPTRAQQQQKKKKQAGRRLDSTPSRNVVDAQTITDSMTDMQILGSKVWALGA